MNPVKVLLNHTSHKLDISSLSDVYWWHHHYFGFGSTAWKDLSHLSKLLISFLKVTKISKSTIDQMEECLTHDWEAPKLEWILTMACGSTVAQW